MADKQSDNDQVEIPETPPKKGSLVKIIVIVVINIIVVGASIGGTLYFSGADSAANEVAAPGQDDEQHAVAEEKKQDAIYKALEPPFVVNIKDDDSTRFLQVAVEVMARDDKAIEAIEHHDARIRNDLILLFSSQTTASLNSLEGKEKLRAAGLKTIQKILEEEIGNPGIEKIYFTSMVMQ